jgi:hypothetical protein
MKEFGSSLPEEARQGQNHSEIMIGKTAAGIRSQQIQWASGRGILLDGDGYCQRPDDNFFQPLSACTRREFEGGDGAELGKDDARGKIQALHSSAALACNVFDYWRGRDLGVLQAAFGFDSPLCGLAFEQKFPTGLRGKPPNLDLVFCASDGEILAVESKFSEAYSRILQKRPFNGKYFPQKSRLWTNHGLEGCQVLAEKIQEGLVTYQRLDALQLLKHVLGLAHNEKRWRLFYLWYDVGGDAGKAHASEVADFQAKLAGDSVKLSSLTYQTLFSRIRPHLTGPHKPYGEYLAERYFAR